MSTQKHTHKGGGGGPLDSREVGLKKEPKEKERDFVLKCVCVFRSFFLCIPSFLCGEGMLAAPPPLLPK